MTKSAPETPSIQSLDRGLTILEAVAKSKRPLAISELKKVLNINRSSVFRLANTLRRRGFLTNPRGSNDYIIGPAVWPLFRDHNWSILAGYCRHHLRALSEETGETSHLCVREGKQAFFVAHQDGHGQIISVSGRTGEFMPLHCTAHGKALLANMNVEELQGIFGDQPLEKHTGSTVSNIEQLAAACAKIRSVGYSIDDGEYLKEVRCLAAPIRDQTNTVVASIGISAPVARMPKERLEVVAKKVIRVAKEINVILNAGS